MDDIVIIVIQNELMSIIQSFISIQLNHYRMIARTIVPPQKKEKGGKRMWNREIVLIFPAKHENEVEVQRSEKLPVKQRCQSLFYENSIESNRWFLRYHPG